MVATRGNREEVDFKSNIVRKGRRSIRTTLEEPEDDIIWESEDTSLQSNIDKRKSKNVGFRDAIGPDSPPLSPKNSRKPAILTRRASLENSKNSSASNDSEKENGSSFMSDQSDFNDLQRGRIYDTDDSLFQSKRSTNMKAYTKKKAVNSTNKGKMRATKRNTTFMVNGGETDKSDHEAGLRRSSRQRKFTLSSDSWLVGDKRLRGYPYMSNRSEDDDDNCIRKNRSYKSSRPSIPTRPLTRFFKKVPAKSNRARGRVQFRQERRGMHIKSEPFKKSKDASDEEVDEQHIEEDTEEEEIMDEKEYEGDREEEEDEKCRGNEDKNEESAKDRKHVKGFRSTRLSRKPGCPKQGRRRKYCSEIYDNSSGDSFSLRDKKEKRSSKRIQRRSSSHYSTRSGRCDEAEDNTEEEEEEEDEDQEEEDEEEDEDTSEDKKKDDEVIKRRPRNEFLKDVVLQNKKRERKPVSRLTYESNAVQRTTYSSSTSSSTSSTSSEDEEENIPSNGQRYSLRQNRKPVTRNNVYPKGSNVRHHSKLQDNNFISSPARKPVFSRKNRGFHRSVHASQNSSGSSSDESHFEMRKSISMNKARARCLPMNITEDDLAATLNKRTKSKVGSSLADVDPMSIDSSITFESVGGLMHHIKSLKEMIIFPLLYTEVFEKFHITPPRGVLFYGPPGTGKTLIARALANECSKGSKKVSFFMRKGADCLSKWVGESERQLRLLFDQAYLMRPSIIFFDEIDGLAPVRSSRQDQIHSSIVSTLLALMDGLDSRGEVVIIGATNRVDAIDPALRRPGRFDREFHFSLPNSVARKHILSIHTSKWEPKPSDRLIRVLANRTVGYCGADLKALCAEAALVALKLRYPQIYESSQKLLLDVDSIRIRFIHFKAAMNKIIPTGHRAVASPGRKLSENLIPLLSSPMRSAIELLRRSFPHAFQKMSMKKENIVANTLCTFSIHRPRFLIVGTEGQGQSEHLAPALIHKMEQIPTYKLDLASLYSVSARAAEEACSQVIHEARCNLPAILFVPCIDKWWDAITDSVSSMFTSMIASIDPSIPLLLFATSNTPYSKLDRQIQDMFSTYRGELLTMGDPKRDEREAFFKTLFYETMTHIPKVSLKRKREYPPLPLAPIVTRELSDDEINRMEEEEEVTLRELRIFLRQILSKLARNKMFYIFTKPVDIDEVADYLEVIQNPMDLETMMTKVDMHEYNCADDMLRDIEQICANALEYNPDRNPEDKVIRHRACTLRDTAYAYIKAEMDTDFEDKCRTIRKQRHKRNRTKRNSMPNSDKSMDSSTLPAHLLNSSISSNNSTQNNDSSKVTESVRKRRRKSTSWSRGLLARKKKSVDKDKECEKMETCNNISIKSDNDEKSYLNKSSGENLIHSSLQNGDIKDEDALDSSGYLTPADELYNKSLSDAISKDRKRSIDHIVHSNYKPNSSIVSRRISNTSDSRKPTLILKGRNFTLSKAPPALKDPDRDHLTAVFQSCIAATSGATVEELLYFYARLKRIAVRRVARESILSDVEAEIRRYAQFHSKR